MANVAKQTFEFTEDRWFLGNYYKAGDRAEFYPIQVANERHSIKPVPAARPAVSKQPRMMAKGDKE